MTASLPVPTFEPLNPEAVKHALALVKSKYCARPVRRDGRHEHISYIGIGDSGGHVEMLVYLAGDPKAYPASEIEIPDLPK